MPSLSIGHALNYLGCHCSIIMILAVFLLLSSFVTAARFEPPSWPKEIYTTNETSNPDPLNDLDLVMLNDLDPAYDPDPSHHVADVEGIMKGKLSLK